MKPLSIVFTLLFIGLNSAHARDRVKQLDISNDFVSQSYDLCRNSADRVAIKFLPFANIDWRIQWASKYSDTACQVQLHSELSSPVISVGLVGWVSCDLHISLSDGRKAAVTIFSSANEGTGTCN